MEQEIETYGGDAITKYTETEDKRQLVWNRLISFCQEHNSYTGEAMQTDDFVIDAPQFVADLIDEVIRFDTKFKDN